MTTADQERWAEALAIERWQGVATESYIANRIATLLEAGDMAGVERFIDIADRIGRLREGTRH